VSHPLLTFYAKVHARRELSKEGYSRRQINDVMGQVDGEAIDAAAALAGPETESEVGKVSAIGDGTILAAIMAFLQSPQGQALIAALMKMLLGLLGG